MAAPSLITLLLHMLSVCRCGVNEGMVLAGPLRKLCVHVRVCVCLQAHSTTFDWIMSERDIHPLILTPPPLVTSCIIDPE